MVYTTVALRGILRSLRWAELLRGFLPPWSMTRIADPPGEENTLFGLNQIFLEEEECIRKGLS